MLTILICWLVAGLLGFCYGKIVRPPKIEEGAGVPMEIEEEKEEEGAGVLMLDTLRDAFTALAPNSRGRGSLEFMQLDILIRKIESGEDIDPSLAIFLLSKIKGAEPWLEKLKAGAGGA